MKRLFSLVLMIATLTGCTPKSPYPKLDPPVGLNKMFGGAFCQVSRDFYGFVHVMADRQPSLMACFGYVHALDRAWQMDYYRRLVQGRTAEIHGTSKLKTDFMMRLLGLYDRAIEIEKSLDSQSKNMLWSYSIGVNRRFGEIRQGDVYEFDQLGYRPEPWTPVDSIALILLQSFDQTRQTFMNGLTESDWIKANGAERLKDYFEDGTPWDTSVLKDTEYTPAAASAATPIEGVSSAAKIAGARGANEWREYFGENLGFGSNNWVVDKSKSATGHPLFANDPHLALKNPPFWHWINLETTNYNGMGAAFPGIPIITSGFNTHVAWGLTNAYLNSGRVMYVPDSDLKNAKSFRPTIYVKVGGVILPFIFKSFQRTETGMPVLPLDAPRGKTLVLNWTGYLMNAENIHNALMISFAKSASSLQSTLLNTGFPSWNFVFADNEGNIGYQTTGKVIKNIGTTPVGVTEGSLAQLTNLEILPDDQMPRLMNPKRGYIATANNRQWPKDAQWHGGHGYRAAFRAFRIDEMLAKKDKHDIASFKEIQCDFQHAEARFIAPELVKLTEPLAKNDAQKKALELLRGWDFNTELTCRPCGVYRRWMDHLKETLKMNEAAIFRLKDRTLSEAEKSTLISALDKSLQDLKTASGEDFPEWGKIHKIYFRHASDDPQFFRDASIPTRGDENVVSPGTCDWTGKECEHRAGPSQRLIVDMGPVPKVWVQLPGSNPDMKEPDLVSETSPWKKWTDCRYTELEWPFNWGPAGDKKLIQF